MIVGANDLIEYMCAFITRYKKEYGHFTGSFPAGLGYPPLEISPFVYAKSYQCYIARDSVITVVYSEEPSGVNFFGRDLGSDEIREGYVGKPIESIKKVFHNQELEIQVEKYDLEGILLLDRLTFGNFYAHFSGVTREGKPIFPTPDIDFWYPLVIRHINFFSYAKASQKFVDYMEISPHVFPFVWDKRNIPARVQFQVRRDFQACSAATQKNKQGSIRISGYSDKDSINLFDRLSKWEKAISDFKNLLKNQPNAEEAVYHNFLYSHPEILDLYGEAESKPRFYFPTGESLLGKAYVEPDFIIAYPNNNYKLVELERPSKQMATKQGQPSGGVGHAVFQTAEWITYIQNHYHLIKEKFPGICSKCSALVIISRSNEEAYKGHSQEPYSQILKAQFGADRDILTYDDLLERANSAYLRMASLV